jgi:hypothetical protein
VFIAPLSTVNPYDQNHSGTYFEHREGNLYHWDSGVSNMSSRDAAIIVAVGLVLLWGVMGISGTETTEQGDHRFVVENQYDESRNVTVTISSSGSNTITTETRLVRPGEQWIVATLDTARLRDGYIMNVSGEYSGRFKSSRGGVGATLVEMGGGRSITCGGTVTCYE